VTDLKKRVPRATFIMQYLLPLNYSGFGHARSLSSVIIKDWISAEFS
jgi:hypothetical protein